MTVIEALKQAEDILNDVSIPVGLVQQIGIPVANVKELVYQSRLALEANAKEQEEKEKTEDPEATMTVE